MERHKDQVIDVYVCMFGPRREFQRLTMARWKQIEEAQGSTEFQIRVSVLAASGLINAVADHYWREVVGFDYLARVLPVLGPRSEFQRIRRLSAQALAGSKVHVVADDDCVPELDAVDKVMALMLNPKYSDFGLVTPTIRNASIQPWTPDNGYKVINDDQVMEHVDTGGIRFTRTGIMPNSGHQWRPQSDNRLDKGKLTGWAYDRDHCEHLRLNGWRVGYAKATGLEHLGEERRVTKREV